MTSIANQRCLIHGFESLQETFDVQQATSTGKISCGSTKWDYQIDVQVPFTAMNGAWATTRLFV